MNLSVLDLFLLSMLDRGAKSAYDLHRRAAISLGASTPSLRKLLENKLVTRQEGKSPTNHRRYTFELTVAGREQARKGWKSWLARDNGVTDLDSVLRIVDMALHYGKDPGRVKRFLKSAGHAKLLVARQHEVANRTSQGSPKPTYVSMRNRCDENRLRTEADALFRIASEIKRPKGVDPDQPMLV